MKKRFFKWLYRFAIQHIDIKDTAVFMVVERRNVIPLEATVRLSTRLIQQTKSSDMLQDRVKAELMFELGKSLWPHVIVCEEDMRLWGYNEIKYTARAHVIQEKEINK